jgi:hypothetical protein
MFTLTDTNQLACHGTSFQSIEEAHNYAISLQELGLCKTYCIGQYASNGFINVYDSAASHQQVKLRHYWNGKEIEVDEGIARLIELIWFFEIKTCDSCQENKPRIAWIQFQDVGNLRLFLNLVGSYPREGENLHESLYGRITRSMIDNDFIKGSWDYSFDIEDHGVINELEEDKIITTHLDFRASVRFPVSDIALLEEILEGKKNELLARR